jgi:hypothetical protein
MKFVDTNLVRLSNIYIFAVAKAIDPTRGVEIGKGTFSLLSMTRDPLLVEKPRVNR